MDTFNKIIVIGLLILVPLAILFNLPPQPDVIYLDFYDQCNWENIDTVSLKAYKENPELLILWDKDQLLNWDNFKGDVEEGDEFDACTYTQIFYDQEHDMIEDSAVPEFYYTNITATAYFRVFHSWVEAYVFEKSDGEQSRLLKHEQGHFDIAEEYLRKFVSIAEKELMGKKFPINGTNPQEIKTNASVEAKRIRCNTIC